MNYTAPLTPLICFYGETQEPWARAGGLSGRYVVVKKVPGMPRFDERFANYAFNKVEWLEHLRYRGYRYWVITDAFGYDIPHPSWGLGAGSSVGRSTERTSSWR